MQYIVIDLEWNGSYSKKAHGYFNEIIEVGAVKVDEQMRIVDEFRAAKIGRITLDKLPKGEPLC